MREWRVLFSEFYMAHLDFQKAHQCATKLGLRNTGLEGVSTVAYECCSELHQTWLKHCSGALYVNKIGHAALATVRAVLVTQQCFQLCSDQRSIELDTVCSIHAAMQSENLQ